MADYRLTDLARAARYRDRAEELRVLSAECVTSDVKVRLASMAEGWDQMARQIESLHALLSY